jgi:hypothetical protein
MTHLAIHTNAPILPLTQMLGDTATIEIGKAAGTNKPDCFYGWAEAQHPDGGCKPHHIVWGMDAEETKWTASVLKMLGFEVVVTAPDLFTEPTGDHHVVEEMPQLYLDEHSH